MHLILKISFVQIKAILQQATVPPVRQNAPNEKNVPYFGFCVKLAAGEIVLRLAEDQGVFDCKQWE